MVKLASRLDNLPPYVFASLAKRIADRRARGDKVINFGMGDPDLPMPDFDSLDRALCERSTVLWLNYPNNPTGAVADLAFFERAVAFAKRYDIVICHDNPYSEITYDDYRAPSILQVPGAREVAVEFN